MGSQLLDCLSVLLVQTAHFICKRRMALRQRTDDMDDVRLLVHQLQLQLVDFLLQSVPQCTILFLTNISPRLQKKPTSNSSTRLANDSRMIFSFLLAFSSPAYGRLNACSRNTCKSLCNFPFRSCKCLSASTPLSISFLNASLSCSWIFYNPFCSSNCFYNSSLRSSNLW